MKKILALLLALMMMGGLMGGALAVNEDVEGELVIYSSMYPFVIDMMDEAIKKEFPNLIPGNDGSFFFYGGTSSLITKIYGEMETGTLGCDMFIISSPWRSRTPRTCCASPLMRRATGTPCACATWCWPTTPRRKPNGTPRA